ncbi:hypothetical protein FXO37_25587 [Capsicum annuum]|nr:hypothetical protein FXO37_25587 [Capsicum annuum]
MSTTPNSNSIHFLHLNYSQVFIMERNINDYKEGFEFIEEVTSNVDEVQKKVLAEILSQNAHVEYLQDHGLNGHTDRDTFKKVIPVITYQDIQPHINRIINGDKSPILCSQPITELLTSIDQISSNKVSKSEASDDDDDGMSHEHVLVFMRD